MDKKGGSSINPNRDLSIETDLLEYFAPDGLTRRELDVLAWVPKGKTNNEIGLLLNISSRTVAHHLGNVYTKFGVESRVEAMVRFFEIMQQAGKLEKWVDWDDKGFDQHPQPTTTETTSVGRLGSGLKAGQL